MWKRLVAGVAGLGLSASVAFAQEAAPAPDDGLLKDIDSWRAREFEWANEPAASQLWGSAELLLGNTTGANVRPLVATGPTLPDFSRNGLGVAGTPGRPGTTTLFGGQKLLDDWRAGLRAEIGMWLDGDQNWGASARFYSLFSTSEQFAAIGDGTNVIRLARPSFPRSGSVGDLFTPEMLDYISFPGFFTGATAMTVQTTFTGGDLNLRRVLRAGEHSRLEAFAGYRQMHLGDELEVAYLVNASPPATMYPLLLSSQQALDSLRTRNNFYGPNVGMLGAVAAGRWSLEGLASVALGVNVSDFDRELGPQGIDKYRHPAISTSEQVSYFSVVAEGGVRAGFHVTEHAMLTIGYTGIYWSNVQRAQEKYSLDPKSTGGTTHVYANLLSLGASLRY